MIGLQLGIYAAENRLVPDRLVPLAIRRLCQQRLQQVERDKSVHGAVNRQLTESLVSGPIASHVDEANRQHYEVPADFFATMLGPHRKYSCCYFADSCAALASAEVAALDITCQRAELTDGQQVLELGCGWGSLSLWMAQHFPHSQITAVSNSHSQKAHIDQQARSRGLANLTTLTTDIGDLELPAQRYDRVVSVEMFEHLRNYQLLLKRIAGWLTSHGKLFVHIFCHRTYAYSFADAGVGDWMGRHFFTGGLMPGAVVAGL